MKRLWGTLLFTVLIGCMHLPPGWPMPQASPLAGLTFSPPPNWVEYNYGGEPVWRKPAGQELIMIMRFPYAPPFRRPLRTMHPVHVCRNIPAIAVREIGPPLSLFTRQSILLHVGSSMVYALYSRPILFPDDPASIASIHSLCPRR
jgi:hypothetical protein